MIRLAAEPLEAGAFAPFGAVVDRPDRPVDASGPGWSWWGENELLAASDRGYGIGYLDLVPGPAGFDWAERHMASQELIAPLGGTCLVYAGPPECLDQPAALPPLDRFRVFRVQPGQAVILAAGVWHGAPLADGGPARAMVLLRKGTGSDDTVVVRFANEAVGIDVGDAHADR
jgi:ureidoglycolate hydrolase